MLDFRSAFVAAAFSMILAVHAEGGTRLVPKIGVVERHSEYDIAVSNAVDRSWEYVDLMNQGGIVSGPNPFQIVTVEYDPVTDEHVVLIEFSVGSFAGTNVDWWIDTMGEIADMNNDDIGPFVWDPESIIEPVPFDEVYDTLIEEPFDSEDSTEEPTEESREEPVED